MFITATRVWTDNAGYEQTAPVLINLDHIRLVTAFQRHNTTPRPMLHWQGNIGDPMILDETFTGFVARIPTNERNRP